MIKASKIFEIIKVGLKRLGMACLVSFIPMLFAVILISSWFNLDIEFIMNAIVEIVVISGVLYLFISALKEGL